jgi:hypothetical protein
VFPYERKNIRIRPDLRIKSFPLSVEARVHPAESTPGRVLQRLFRSLEKRMEALQRVDLSGSRILPL